MKNGEVVKARNVYERAVEKLADDEEAEQLFVAFAEFEERCKETERARCIYKFALDHIPKGRAEDLYRKFVAFEKQYGDREGIEDAIVGKRRFQYEDEVRKNPLNYDSWFDYIRLEESMGNKERTREVYERAIANVPPAEEKRYWQRYIYLWINYALYEELDAGDVERTREAYIDFETAEGEFERARVLYERLLDRTKHLKVWISYAEFEATAMDNEDLDLSEHEQKKKCIQRARRVFEEALNYFRSSAPDLKEERAMLLEKWLNMEASSGELGDVSLVQSKLPKKLKKRRQVTTEDGSTRIEEFIDYLFPEETQTTNLKILEAAYKWKKQKLSSGDD